MDSTDQYKRIMIKAGGSLLFTSNLQPRLDFLAKFTGIMQRTDEVVGIVMGGGKIARTYIQAARGIQADESLCDTLGIGISRLNARLLIAALGFHAYPSVITEPEQARIADLWKKIIVAGGFIPGQSTTSVTFELAEVLSATDVIILTDVDGIYDKDPHKFPDAVKFDEITADELEKVISEGGESQAAAGEYRIFDAVSLQIFRRSHFQVRIIDGNNLETLSALLIDRQFDAPIGTKILP